MQLVTTAFPAAHVRQVVLLTQFPKVTASTLSTLIFAQNVVLARMFVR